MVFRKILRFLGCGGTSSHFEEEKRTKHPSSSPNWEEPVSKRDKEGMDGGSRLYNRDEIVSTTKHNPIPQLPVFFPPPTSSDGSDSTTSTHVIPSVYRRPSGKQGDQGVRRKEPSEVSWEPGRAVITEEDEFSDMRSTSSGYVSIMRGRPSHGGGKRPEPFPPPLPLQKVGSGSHGRQPSMRRTRSHSPEQHTQRVYPIHETSFEQHSRHSEPEVIEPVIYEYENYGEGEADPEMFHYIIPGGLNVIFWDNDGKEITRVGEFGNSVNRARRVSPTIIQDELGNELYRTGDFTSKSTGRPRTTSMKGRGNEEQPEIVPLDIAISYASVPREARNIILIDDKGKEVPL